MAPVFAAGPSSRRAAVEVALAVVVVVMLTVGPAGADFAADRAECADKLMGLATCLTYVQVTATARSPTPDCCAGFKTVLASSKKCLCVLVKDRDEPALGIKFNVTRAMDLPSACSLDATFSDCPQILNMSPDSKEAEIFKEYAREHESKNGTATAAAAGGASGKSAGTAAAAAATGGAEAGAGAGRVQRGTVLFGVVTALLASAVIGLA